MNLRRIALFALLAGALLLYVFYVELPQGEKATAKEKLFPRLSREQIESIAIVNKSGSFTLVNTEPVKQAVPSAEKEAAADLESARLSRWQLGDVQGADLDRAALSALLGGLVEIRLQEPIPDSDAEKDMGVYGLGSPEVTLAVKDPSGLTEIRLGKKNEYLSKRYLSVSGRAGIYLVPEMLFTAAGKSRTDFRNKSPIELADTDISEITLSGGESKIRIQAVEPGKWKIVEPFETAASTTAVSALIMNLRNLRATDFVDDVVKHFSEFRLDKPDLKVLLGFNAAAKRTALDVALSRVAGDKPEESGSSAAYALVQGKPGIYKLGSDPITSILKPLNDFREKQLFQFSVDQAVQLDIERDDAPPLSLIKAGENWTVNGKEADAVFAREVIKNFSQLEAVSFPSENRDFGFAAPHLKAVVRFAASADGKATGERVLVIGGSADTGVGDGKGFFAGADDLSVPFIISRQSFDKLAAREEALLKTETTPEPLKAETASATE